MAWPEQQVRTWEDFVQVASQVVVSRPAFQNYAFRGQADTEWRLVPSLTRLMLDLNLEPHQALEVEKAILKQFEAQAHLHLDTNVLPEMSDDSQHIAWWTLMQHYHAPTRLLDWTGSIYIAAYYAVMEKWDRDGAIWLFHTYQFEEGMRRQVEGYNPASTLVFNRDQFLDPGAPGELYVFTHGRQTDRMVAQQGIFTLCKQILADHGEIIENNIATDGPELYLQKIVIKRDLKPRFLRQLRAANITANALFPGVDGLGRSLEELARMEAHHLRGEH